VAARDTAPRDAIERPVLAFPGSGSRRVTKARHRDGWETNHKRVLRVMRREAARCQRHRRCVVTTDSAHAPRTDPNPPADVALAGPGQARVADITDVRLPTAFASLAGVLDARSRRCVGWHLSRGIDTDPTLAALDHAIAARQPPPGFIHHSDRGVQYASAADVARRREVGARVSLAAVGNPDDNAKAERFFKTLKREEVSLNHDQTFQEAEIDLGRFIADVDNAKRRHSRLGDRPPIAFEAVHAATARR